MQWSASVIIGAVLSYMLGSVSFALFVAKYRGIDLKAQGSGNLGATNAGRVLGRPVGIAIFILDCLKGFVPAFWFPRIVIERGVIDWSLTSLGLLFGASAMIGHVFPFYLGFRGGKGVATGAGVFLALAPLAALSALGIWTITLIASRYVSLASILAAAALPVAILLLGAGERTSREGRLLPLAAAAVAALVIFGHRDNIRRIFQGTERRIGSRA